MMIRNVALQVTRKDITRSRVISNEISLKDLQPGEVVMKVNEFAFTSNNITYASFGNHMKYFEFWPTADPKQWAHFPVWGFADVVQSKCEGVSVGERFYGAYCPAQYVSLIPTKVTRNGFTDGAEYRKPLAPVYNNYLRCSADPSYSPYAEALIELLRPLYMTSWLIDDWLEDNKFYGAKSVLISSASSKTSIGLAFQLAQRQGHPVQIIGLTSPNNVRFCEDLGFYDTVVPYDRLERDLDCATSTVFVDMAGSNKLRRNIHHHWRDNLKYSCSVGATFWDDRGRNDDLPGPKPLLFFAPAQAQKRNQEWGPEQFQRKTGADWAQFVNDAGRWMQVKRIQGPENVSKLFDDLLVGKVDPKLGYVASMHQSESRI
eukprot:Clim_evm2s74 gene=Clim_evmTU2s74